MTKLPSQYKYQKSIWSLTFTCAILFVSYLSLVGKTVTNVLDRQNDEASIAEIVNNVSQVEFAYLNEKSAINADYARSRGFMEIANTLIAKQKNIGNLSLNEI